MKLWMFKLVLMFNFDCKLVLAFLLYSFYWRFYAICLIYGIARASNQYFSRLMRLHWTEVLFKLWHPCKMSTLPTELCIFFFFYLEDGWIGVGKSYWCKIIGGSFVPIGVKVCMECYQRQGIVCPGGSFTFIPSCIHTHMQNSYFTLLVQLLY